MVNDISDVDAKIKQCRGTQMDCGQPSILNDCTEHMKNEYRLRPRDPTSSSDLCSHHTQVVHRNTLRQKTHVYKVKRKLKISAPEKLSHNLGYEHVYHLKRFALSFGISILVFIFPGTQRTAFFFAIEQFLLSKILYKWKHRIYIYSSSVLSMSTFISIFIHIISILILCSFVLAEQHSVVWT